MANIKISELNPLLTVEDADVLPIVDNAVTKKVTAAILRSYTEGNSVLLTGAQTIAGIKTFTSQLASSVATGTAPFSVASTTKVTNLNADLLDGLSSADFQATLSGSGIVKSTSGTISYLTDNSTNWNTAYNDKINSAAVTGSGINTLTLTQQDAGTITATWVNGTLIREIRNNTGATLTKGTIVYISGATGNKPTVSKALATGDSTSAQTFGFVQEDILNNANGYVVVIGDLTGVDTSAFTEGAQLYLSATTAGTFTDVKQYAPNHLVYVGIVTRSHPTLGQIEVNIQNGYELDELHNVSAQNPSNGDILQYVTSTGLWTKIAGTTSAISEGSNLYFTNARSRSAISLTTTGTSGAATYNSTTGVLNVPNYADTDTGITSLNDLTDLSQTFETGTSGTDFGISSSISTHTFNLPTASATNRGALSSADWTTFNNKQNALTNPITGTGTTNYLPKFTGASALGNSLVYDDGTNVGIGTTTPDRALTVNGQISLNGDLISTKGGTTFRIGYESYTATGGVNMFTEGAVPLVLGTTSTERMRITSSGNVGIGTSTPLNNAGSTAMQIVGADYPIFTVTSSNQSINAQLGVGLGAGYVGTTTNHPFSVLSGGNLSTRFATSGNVLIGTTTDAGYKLDVNGTARVTGAATFSSSVTATRGIFNGSTGETLTAQGVAGEWTTHITGSASTGNSYGLVVNAGTNASDLALGIYNQAFNATLFTVKGDGSLTAGADATINGVKVGRGAGNIATNTATGFEAINSNVSGTGITATGYQALRICTGNNNTAFGNQAGQSVTTSQGNTGVGSGAIRNTSTGGFNVAIGINALSANTTGGNNTAVGNSALSLLNGSFNSALGANTQHGGFSSSVILGADATATASNQFVVGSSARNAGTVATEVNTSTKVWNVIINGVAQKILLA